MDFIVEETKLTYSEKVMDSDVFTLLAVHSEKSDAFIHSAVNAKSTFYDYAKLLPLKPLFSRQKLSRIESFKALSVIKNLENTHSQEIVNKVLNTVFYDGDFKERALALANNVGTCINEINDVLMTNYEVIDFGGYYLPVKEKGSKIKVEDKLLALSVWSISITPKGALETIKSKLPEEHYLQSSNSRSALLSKLISNLFRALSVDIAYQATELLITTRTAYKNAALELLTNGWLVSE